MSVTSIDNELACVATSSTVRNITLNAHREYTITHTGVRVNGSTFDVNIVIVMTSESVSGQDDLTEELYKYPVMSDDAVAIGPGVGKIWVRSISGTPVISINPSSHKFGGF